MIQHPPSYDLQQSNTLNLPCIAQHYIEISNEADLVDAFNTFQLNSNQLFILGGGSNVILPPTLNQYILSFKTKAPHDAVIIKNEDDKSVLLEVEAGVEWDSFVDHCVQQSYFGLENLSLIPGTVGAAPIQNIGAYGVEVADSIDSVNVFNVRTRKIECFSAEQCQFAYRDSFFKRHPQQFIIVSVNFRLSKQAAYCLGYGELSALKNNPKLSHQLVRKTIIETRQSKLPDPKVLPNAGSFFKNPIVDADQMITLQQRFPTIVNYPLDSGMFKLAAAWLIDQAGWKGFRNAHVGIHDKQALVVVNHNLGSQRDILALASAIQQSVHEQFGVSLEIEPVVM